MRLFSLLFLLNGLLVCVSSQAADFCVSTTQQLRASLTGAQNNGQADTIRVRSGTYPKRLASDPAGSAAPSFSYNSSETLSMSGGWSGPNGTCTQQEANPSLTELDGVHDGIVLWMRLIGSNSILIRNLSVVRGGFGSNFPNDASMAVYLETVSGATGNLVFENNRVADGFGRAYQSGLGISALNQGGSLYLRNNLIVGNLQTHFTEATGGASLSAQAGASYINGNSFVGNATASPFVDASGKSAGGLYVERVSGLIHIANNLFSGNQTDVLSQQPREHSLSVRSLNMQAGVELNHNHLGDVAQAPFAAGVFSLQAANTTGDPQISGGAWPQPQAGSILVDSGAATPSGGVGSVDLLGGARVSGERVDRGALEYRGPLLSDGFESP